MRLIILSTAMTGILLAGCATHPVSVTETTQWIQTHERQVKITVRAVKQVSLQLAIKDPEKRKDINTQISLVAFQLRALLAQGDFDPESVAAALKIKEPEVQLGLTSIADLYAIYYEDLSNRDQTQLAIVLLRAIADGLAPPPAPPESLLK